MKSFLLSVLLLSAFSYNASSQAVKASRPAAPPDKPFVQTAVYWTTEGAWHSELHLRNNMSSGPLVISPVLHAADGEEYKLPDIALPAKAGKVVDLHKAILENVPELEGQFGSLDLHYSSPSYRALYAAVMVHEMAKPFDFHMDAFGPAPDKTSGSREGIWWFGTSTAKDVLVIANKSDETIPVTMTVYRPDGTAFKVPLSLAAHAAERLSVRDLLAAHGWTDTYGGLDIRAEKKAGYVDTIHYVVDETANFSAQLKMFDYDGKATMAERGWNKGPMWTTRAPMLALTNPDPAMKLPKGTTLHPKLYIRNTTEHPIDTSIAFNWRNEEKHGNSVGPSFTLGPLETRYVDVSELQRKNLLPLDATWSSVYISGGTKPDEIMAIAASFSDEGHYGAQTPFNDQLAFHWAGGIWVVDALHDSLTTVGNGTDHATTASLLLYTQASANAGDAVSSPVPYEWQQELGPGEHMWVDIADLVRGGKPDIHGRVLPVGLKTGTYEFKDNSNDGRGTLFEGKVIVDKTNGHATYGCMECCGYNFGQYISLGVPYQSNQSAEIDGSNSCGDSGDISGLFTYWTSSDTSKISVDNNGTEYGVAIGSAEIIARAYNVEEDGGGADSLHCPTSTITSSGPDDTDPTVTTSGPPDVALSNGESAGNSTNTVEITATGDPAGGTYQWTSSNGNVSLSNDTQAVVSATASSAGSSALSVVYTVSGVDSQPNVFTLNVVQPSSVVIVSDTGVQLTNICYPGVSTQQYKGPQRQVVYNIEAVKNGTLQNTSATTLLSEQFTVLPSPSPSCGSTPSATTNAVVNGQYSDTFNYCSPQCFPVVNQSPQGSCTLALHHTWTANGFTIFDHTLTYQCTNITPQ